MDEDEKQALVKLDRAQVTADSRYVTDFEGTVRAQLAGDWYGGQTALSVLNGTFDKSTERPRVSLFGITGE